MRISRTLVQMVHRKEQFKTKVRQGIPSLSSEDSCLWLHSPQAANLPYLGNSIHINDVKPFALFTFPGQIARVVCCWGSYGVT